MENKKLKNDFNSKKNLKKLNDTPKMYNNASLHTFNILSNKNNLIKNSRDKNYKNNLVRMYSDFLVYKKFRISNAFDANHSKKFLYQKNKYLEKIVLNDTIKDNDEKSIKKNLKKYKSSKYNNSLNNMNNYFIIISNYDEEQKRTKSSKMNNYKVNIINK